MTDQFAIGFRTLRSCCT